MDGTATSAPEVTRIGPEGLWLVVDGREHFLSFEDFPWFRDAAVEAVFDVERPHADHLRWPELDIDLVLESIEHPERFPLKSRIASGRARVGGRDT